MDIPRRDLFDDPAFRPGAGPRLRPAGVDPEAWDKADDRERKRLIRKARG